MNAMRWLAALAAMLALAVSPNLSLAYAHNGPRVIAEPSLEGDDDCDIVAITDGLKVRTIPATDAPALGELTIDAVVTSPNCNLTADGGDYSDCSTGNSASLWAQIDFNGIPGWVASDCTEVFG